MLHDRREDGAGRVTQVLAFDGVSDMLDNAIPVAEASCRLRRTLKDSEWVGRSFDGGWGEVACAAASPWEDGETIVSGMLEQLTDAVLPMPQSRRRVSVWGDDGDELCRDRLESGFPAWRGTRRACRSGPATVTIVADVTASCSKSPEDILWRGAAAVALATMLEHAGYRVAVWGAFHGSCMENGESVLSTWCLKTVSDPLDSGPLIAGLSGWYFRTAVFASCELATGTLKEDLGRAMELPEWIGDVVGDPAPRVVSGVWGLKSAVEWLRAALEGGNHAG